MSTPTSRFTGSINIPIAIPAWGLLTLIAGALFTAGTLYSQMNTLIEVSHKSEDKIASIQSKQGDDRVVISNLQSQVQNHEFRLSTMERIAIDRKR